MGRFTFVGLLAICFLSACDPRPEATTAPPTLDGPPAPPPPPSGAFLAQLDPDQTAQLNQLGVDVVVPGVVPPGFRVAAIELGPENASYLIAYQNDQNRCFAIEFTAAEATAPPPTQERLPVDPPLFEGGYGLNFQPPASAPERLYSDWLPGAQGAYRLVGISEISAKTNLSQCQNIDPEVAVDILESLTVISSEVVGDG